MRFNILKKNSTKPERVVYEVLKSLKIPFRHRWIIDNREIDFVLYNKICIEIDGHDQDVNKNNSLVSQGYQVYHIHNKEVNKEKVINLIKNINGN